jgi:hypothetical protein
MEYRACGPSLQKFVRSGGMSNERWLLPVVRVDVHLTMSDRYKPDIDLL